MNKQLKLLLIIVPLCFILSGLTVFIYLADPEFSVTPLIVSSMVIATVWVFFFLPSLPFAINLVKNHLAKIDCKRAFFMGYFLARGWGFLVFLFFLIISPVSGSIWFIQTVKSIISEKTADKVFGDDFKN